MNELGPVTAKPTEDWRSEFDSDIGPETEWTAANIQEALPGLITPMTWSLSRPLLEYAFAHAAERVARHVPPADGYVASFYGRVFLNLTALRDGATRVPFSSPAAVDEHYLGKTLGPGARLWRPTFDQRLERLRLTPRVAFLLLRSAAELRTIERRVARSQDRDRELDFEALSAASLVALLETGNGLGRDVAAAHIGISGGATAAFGLLGQLTRDWFEDDDGSLRAVLWHRRRLDAPFSDRGRGRR